MVVLAPLPSQSSTTRLCAALGYSWTLGDRCRGVGVMSSPRERSWPRLGRSHFWSEDSVSSLMIEVTLFKSLRLAVESMATADWSATRPKPACHGSPKLSLQAPNLVEGSSERSDALSNRLSYFA